MVTAPEPDTEHLLDSASRGDAQARGRLLERHRPRLKRMVAVRLDRRLAARVDPSDVVQEALTDAAAQLDGWCATTQTTPTNCGGSCRRRR
jgi:RNA polymerase sigma-70 factor (ECF subfamily)